jgi:uncharacterized protein YndB with AHSA1/START domain
MATLSIDRHFRASPEAVFAYLTQTDKLLEWWGPAGTTVTDHSLDLSRLGEYWFDMSGPEDRTSRVTGEVLEIDPPRLVEFTMNVPGQPGWRGIDSLVRFELAPDGDGGTRFRLIQSGLTDEQLAEGSKQGWVGTLARLERILNGI